MDYSKKRVAVIGAGVIGLSTAYKLLCDYPGLDLTVFYSEASPNTTGDVSAGWIYPSKVNGRELEIKRWFDSTFQHLSKLHKKDDTLEMGVAPISGFLFDPPQFILDVCGKWMKEMTADEKSTFLSFDWQKRHQKVYSLTTWTCDCTYYLPWLMEQIDDLNGKFVKKTVQSFAELASFDIIVNCSGLGAKNLANDADVYPVKGQVYNVKAPWIKHFYRFADNLYVLPKLYDVVLGGTRDEKDQLATPNRVESERIWETCCENIPSLKRAEIIKQNVGFRPTRKPAIRLEMEKNPVRDQVIVHNYGHGGSGVTLHWGCASEVSDLLKGHLCMTSSKL